MYKVLIMSNKSDKDNIEKNKYNSNKNIMSKGC